MRRIPLALLLLPCLAAAGAVWNVIGEVPVLGVPQDIVDRGDGTYLVVFRGFDDGGYFLRGKLVGASGMVADSSVIIPPEDPGVTFQALALSEASFTGEETPMGVVRVAAEGDTLWTCVLDSVTLYEIPGVLIEPSASGGCWALFGPEQGGDLYRIWRLSPSGRVEASGTFVLQGGPINGMNDMLECPDGGLLLTGVTDSLGMNLYMVLVRLDAECREVWRILDDVRFHASGDLLRMDPDGNIYVAGYTGLERSDGWFMPPERMDVFLFTLDPGGAYLRKSVLHLPGQNAPLAMTLLDGGGAVLLVSSFEENSSFPGRYSLVTCLPD